MLAYIYVYTKPLECDYIVAVVFTYICLNHFHPLSPDLVHNCRDIHNSLPRCLLKSNVNCDQSACPANTSTAIEPLLPVKWYYLLWRMVDWIKAQIPQ